MAAFPNILQGEAVKSIDIISGSPLTSVTAKLLLPQGTTLYHLSCSTSINPCDLYWLISSDMLEVKGELGGRPMPYPRRKYNLRWVFHLRVSWDVATTPDTAVRPGNKDIVSFPHLSLKGLRNVLGMITMGLLLLWVKEMSPGRREMICVLCSRDTLYSKAFCPSLQGIFQKPSFRSLLGLGFPIYFSQKPSSGP